MIRPIYVELIIEFLIAKPNVPYEKLQHYIHEIGATEDEAKEALIKYSVLKEKHEKNPLSELNDNKTDIATVDERTLKNIKLKDLFKLTYVYIAIASFLILSIGYYLFPYVNNSKNQNIAKIESPKISNIKQLSNSNKLPIVFASSNKIDSQKIFSFPKSSDITLPFSGTPKKEVFAFFPYWMADVKDEINLNGITTLSIFGIDVNGQGSIIIKDSEGKENPGWTIWRDPKLNDFIKKAKLKRIKVVLTIKSFDNDHIETLVKSDQAQKTFISNAVQLVNSKGLDGINLDFEYVGEASKETKDGFTRLVKNLNSELKRQIKDSSLTVDTYAISGAEFNFFDVPLLAENSDALVVMGYDFHTPLGTPGAVAPMEGEGGILGYMQSYLEKIPAEKIILAVPYYGYDWPLDDKDESQNSKTLAYAEIANMAKNLTISWNETSQTPYLNYIDKDTGTKRVVHYENTRSLAIKYDYINKKDLKGVGIWALGYDGLNQDLQQLLFEKFAR